MYDPIRDSTLSIESPSLPPSSRSESQSDTKKNNRLMVRGWLASFGLVATLFVVDLLTPLGYAVSMLYALPILLTRLMPDLRSTLIMSGVTISLTWVGAELSPDAIAQHDNSNRIMATVLLLGITWMLVTQKQAARQVEAAQGARYESEERLRLFIEHAPVALAMFDREMHYLAVSRRWNTDYGLGDKDIIGHSHYDIFPNIPVRWRAIHQRGLAGEVVREDEDLFEQGDGSERWLCWEVRPWQTNDGHVGGVIIFTEDITDRKRAKTALLQSQKDLRDQQTQLQDLTARLLTAQEEERKRIARDLHDDFTQRLAAVTIDLQRLSVRTTESNASHPALLTQLGEKTEQLTSELQQLAHQLHSSLLEHVGLEAAIRECVDEFSMRAGWATEIVVRELPAAIPLLQATCLYRILQESLQNAQKHAEATNILVRILCTRNGLGICIQDDGRGFDQLEKAARPKGLGLSSMAERVKALHGTFCVRSDAGMGTEVHAWVPLSELSNSR